MNQHNLQKQEKRQVIRWLIDNFPAAFFQQASEVKPLKIGIYDDIIDFYERLDSPPFSKKQLREALNYYSMSPAYLRCQQTQRKRIDLFGQEVDIITEEQAQYAAERFQQRYQPKNNL